MSPSSESPSSSSPSPSSLSSPSSAGVGAEKGEGGVCDYWTSCFLGWEKSLTEIFWSYLPPPLPPSPPLPTPWSTHWHPQRRKRRGRGGGGGGGGGVGDFSCWNDENMDSCAPVWLGSVGGKNPWYRFLRKEEIRFGNQAGLVTSLDSDVTWRPLHFGGSVQFVTEWVSTAVWLVVTEVVGW